MKKLNTRLFMLCFLLSNCVSYSLKTGEVKSVIEKKDDYHLFAGFRTVRFKSRCKKPVLVEKGQTGLQSFLTGLSLTIYMPVTGTIYCSK